MEISGVQLLTYQQVLESIEGEENHLLLGNGFNRGLGIDTSYASIFQKMIDEKYSVYGDVSELAKDCKYDLELFLGKLEEDISVNNTFLKKFISNKIKLDFMRATHEIVKSELKNIYSENNDGIFILLKQFSNYFTLNYDPFLYLLLLDYKAPDKGGKKAIALNNTIKFALNDLNNKHDHIYNEIKKIRDGSLTISPSEIINPTNAPLDKVTKTTFTTIINQYSKSNQKNWKSEDIKIVVNFILEEEKQNQVLEGIDDGAQLGFFGDEKEIAFDINSKTQNIYFLHGAFHIYKKGKSIRKITQQRDKALYSKIEDILNNEDQEIVCIFQSDNKLDVIKENEYLTKCYNALETLSGNLVIMGSALSENDTHIFDQINKSSIENIFITSMKFDENEVEKAQSIFPDKSIFFLDVSTITYKSADN